MKSTRNIPITLIEAAAMFLPHAYNSQRQPISSSVPVTI